jgi:predicted RNA-binding Zn ribbon-like protein
MSTGTKKPPDEIELVSSFINTMEKNTSRPDTEWLDSPEALRSWMNAHDIPTGDALGSGDVTRATDFREALRVLLLANNGVEVDPAAVRALRDAAQDGLIQVEIDTAGRAAARPAGSGVPALFARLLAAVADSQAAGTWDRLKACAADDCQWAFYDSSRNRSRTWCSMEVCGNRAKTRAYRARLSGG